MMIDDDFGDEVERRMGISRNATIFSVPDDDYEVEIIGLIRGALDRLPDGRARSRVLGYLADRQAGESE